MEQKDNKNDNVFAYLYKSQERYETHKELLRAEQLERQCKEETFVPTITNLVQSLSKKRTERREQHTFERLYNLHKCKQLANSSEINTLNNEQINYEQKEKSMSVNLHHDDNRNSTPSQFAKMSAGNKSVVQEQDTTWFKNNASVCEDNSEVETQSEDCTFKPNLTPASEVLSRVYYQQHAMGKLNVYDRLYCPSHSISATQANGTNAFAPLWNFEEIEEYCYSTGDSEHFNGDSKQNKRTHGNSWKDKTQNALPAHMYKIDNYLCNDWANNNNLHTESHSKNEKREYQPLWELDASFTRSSETNNTTHKKTSAVTQNCHTICNASRNKSKKTEEVSECTNDNCTFRPCINRTSQELWERKVEELKTRGMAATKSDARRVMEHEAQRRKENELAAIQHEQNEKEMYECTFQPFASEHHERELELVPRSHAAGLNREYVHIPFIERTKLYEQQRRNERDNLRLHYDEELKKECSFAPHMINLHKGTKHLCTSKAKKRSSSGASVRLASPAAAINTSINTSSSIDVSHKIPGYAKHIERQRSLRHDKKWENNHTEHSLPRYSARRNSQEESREQSVNNVDNTLMCEELEQYYPYANHVRSSKEIESNSNEETHIYEDKIDDKIYTNSEEPQENSYKTKYISTLNSIRKIDRSSVLAQRDVNIDGACPHRPVKQKQKFKESSGSESKTFIACTATTAQWIPQLKYNANSMRCVRSV